MKLINDIMRAMQQSGLQLQPKHLHDVRLTTLREVRDRLLAEAPDCREVHLILDDLVAGEEPR